MERGEVRAYPNVKSDLDDPFDNAPLSPLGEEAALLRAPMEVKREEPTGLQTPVHSRVAQLRQTLRHVPASSPTSSSPATHVTQVNTSLFVDDNDVPCSTPVARRSPHLTFDSGSSRAYPSISVACAQVQLDVSDGSSVCATPEHMPRSMRLHPKSPSRSKGVKYRSLSDLDDTENLDARIWRPQSPIFNPDKVKRWPKPRSPSPTKKETPLPSDEVVGDSIALVDASFVRADRGRHSRLTPSWSLPILPNQEVEGDCADIGSRPTQARENPHTVNVRAKEIVHSVSDKHLAERKNYVESHAQTASEGGDGQCIIVHCSASCAHAGVIHVPQRGIAPDLDVRSPISKGTLVPLNAAE